MLNRPLPATPPSDDKSKRKSKPSKSTEGRKSLISMLSQKQQSEDGRGSPRGSRAQLNGQSNGSPVRPPSVQYQNSSPIHDRSDSSDPHNSSDDTNCDTMYAGPPTPFRYYYLSHYSNVLVRIHRIVCFGNESRKGLCGILLWMGRFENNRDFFSKIFVQILMEFICV